MNLLAALDRLAVTLGTWLVDVLATPCDSEIQRWLDGGSS